MLYSSVIHRIEHTITGLEIPASLDFLFTPGLSKWLRNKVVHHNNFRNLLSSLQQFTKARLENTSPNSTTLQTPTSTPKTSKDSNESKSSQESPISVNSSSLSPRTPSTKNTVNISDVKHEPGSITSSIPNCPQSRPPEGSNQISEKNHVTTNAATPSTPQLLTSANQVSSSTPIVGRGVAPKVLRLSPLNRPQTAGAMNSLQRMVNAQRMVNPQQMVNLHNLQVLNNPQVMNNQRPANNPQQVIHLQPINSLRQPVGVNRPVLVRFVTPSGQPVRHALISGQQLQFVTQQTSGNSRIVFNVAGGGQQGAPGVRLLHQGGVGQGILMNMNGQPGECRGLLSAPGTVRVKQEPISPPDTQRGTSRVNQGLHVNQGDALGNCAAGMRLDSNLTQDGSHRKGNRVQRRSLFSSNESSVCGGDQTTRKANKDMNDVHNESESDCSTLLKGRKNVPEPLQISKSGVTEPKDGIPEDDPESPLLFCTPPTSFENDDDKTENDAEGGEGIDKEKMGQRCASSDMNVLEDKSNERMNRVNLQLGVSGDKKIPQSDGSRGLLQGRRESMDTSVDKKVLEGNETRRVNKSDGGSAGMDEADRKVILDFIDDQARTTILNVGNVAYLNRAF